MNCLISGLPIDYYPNVRSKKALRYTIPFHSISLENTRQIVTLALLPFSSKEDRIFAFFCLFYKIPPQLLTIASTPCPDFANADTATLIAPTTLSLFSIIVSSLVTLSESKLEALPSYRISSSYLSSNSSLEEFPQQIVYWGKLLASMESLLADKRAAHRIEKATLRLGEVASIFTPSKVLDYRLAAFDPTKAVPEKLNSLIATLAIFYGRPNNSFFQSMARTPWIFSVIQLTDFLDLIREINAGEHPTAMLDFLPLSRRFQLWLETALAKIQQQEEMAAQFRRDYIAPESFIDCPEPRPNKAHSVRNLFLEAAKRKALK
jgi:hypothetical protein